MTVTNVMRHNLRKENKNPRGTGPGANFVFDAIMPYSAKISAANWTDINSSQHNKTILISL